MVFRKQATNNNNNNKKKESEDNNNNNKEIKNILPLRQWDIIDHKKTVHDNFRDDETRKKFTSLVDEIYEETLAKLDGNEPDMSSVCLGLLMKHSVQFFLNEIKTFRDTGEYDEGLVNHYVGYVNKINEMIPVIRDQGMEAAKFLSTASRGKYVARDDVGIRERIMKNGVLERFLDKEKGEVRNATDEEKKKDSDLWDLSKAEYGMASPQDIGITITTRSSNAEKNKFKCGQCGQTFIALTPYVRHKKETGHIDDFHL